MSVAVSGSLVTGSGGIGVSRTGSGGAGGRVGVVSGAIAGGGGIGRATGGFFLADAPRLSASATAMTTPATRLLCMLSLFRSGATTSREHEMLATGDWAAGYCDQ